MNRPTRTPTSLAKVSVERATVRPRAKPGAKPIAKASPDTDGPFAVFSEWSNEADEKAYTKL
jgi:hypothetical protein